MNTYGASGYPANPYPASMGPSQLTLRRVGVGSAFKVSAVLSALIWAVFGLFFLILGLCGAWLRSPAAGTADGALAAGGVVFVFVYLIGIFIYAVFGGIVGAFYAWLYNVTARWTGGLELDVS